MKQKAYVLFSCPCCQKEQRFFFKKGQTSLFCQDCSYCQSIVQSFSFEQCVFCSCKAFFVQKNTPPLFMFTGLLVAIIFVPLTYGLSLFLLWVLDLLLVKVISDVLVCYQCQSSFCQFSFPKRFKPFQHHIGERYDKKVRN